MQLPATTTEYLKPRRAVQLWQPRFTRLLGSDDAFQANLYARGCRYYYYTFFTTTHSTIKEETRCSSSSSSTCISVRDNACSGAVVRPCLRFTNALGQLRTIATSSRQQEGEMSHDIVLKLQSLDFGDVYRRRDKFSLNRTKVSRTTSILTVEMQLAWALVSFDAGVYSINAVCFVL